jgi:hypothetical protein
MWMMDESTDFSGGKSRYSGSVRIHPQKVISVAATSVATTAAATATASELGLPPTSHDGAGINPHLCIDPRHEMLNTQSMRITSIITILPLTLKKHSTSIYGTRAVRRLPEEYLQYVRVARAFVSTLAQVPE